MRVLQAMLLQVLLLGRGPSDAGSDFGLVG